MSISKIDQYGLGSKVLKLKDEGHSFDIISKIISDEAGTTISRGSVDRFLKKVRYDELHRLEDTIRKFYERFSDKMLKHLTYEERGQLSKSLQEALRGIGMAREYINGMIDETREIREWLRDDVAGGMILIGEKHMDAEGMKELKELIKKL